MFPLYLFPVVSNSTCFFVSKTLIYGRLQIKRALTSLFWYNIRDQTSTNQRRQCSWTLYNKYKVLNEVEMLQGAGNMPGKWQLLIFLGQQTILNMQKNNTAAGERGCWHKALGLSCQPEKGQRPKVLNHQYLQFSRFNRSYFFDSVFS